MFNICGNVETVMATIPSGNTGLGTVHFSANSLNMATFLIEMLYLVNLFSCVCACQGVVTTNSPVEPSATGIKIKPSDKELN